VNAQQFFISEIFDINGCAVSLGLFDQDGIQFGMQLSPNCSTFVDAYGCKIGDLIGERFVQNYDYDNLSEEDYANMAEFDEGECEDANMAEPDDILIGQNSKGDELKLTSKELQELRLEFKNFFLEFPNSGKMYNVFKRTFLTSFESGFFTSNHPDVIAILAIPGQHGYDLVRDLKKNHVHFCRHNEKYMAHYGKDTSGKKILYDCVPL